MDTKLKECPFCGGDAVESLWPEGVETGKVFCPGHGNKQRDIKWGYLRDCPIEEVEFDKEDWEHRSTIAPPVAAGSVDTITIHGIVYDAMSIERVITELREENKNVSARHEEGAQALQKAEADLKQVNEWRAAALAESQILGELWAAKVEKAEAESVHKQAIIDRLMLEYCPDEMTPQQVKEWGEHQVRAPAGIIGSGPNAKEGDRPCWTPDCGTF